MEAAASWSASRLLGMRKSSRSPSRFGGSHLDDRMASCVSLLAEDSRSGAYGALEGAVYLQAALPSGESGFAELVGDRLSRPEVHLVRRLAGERRVRQS